MKQLLQHILRRCRFYPTIAKNLWLGWRLNRRYGYPARSMRLIGVTGTDGKTTTTYLLQAILKAAGRKVGLISTVGAMIDGQLLPTGLHVSTPGPGEVYALLDQMRSAGVTEVIVEVTSHGLDQRRVAGLQFEVAVVTNITPEHLDYHGSFAEYVRAKSRLVRSAAVAVLNAEDDSTLQLQSMARRSVLFGGSASAMVRAEQIMTQDQGSNFELMTPGGHQPIQINLPGRHNVMNSLAAAAVALELGIELKQIADGLAQVEVVPGRWQVIQERPFMVVVDFAHTAEAFTQVLATARTQVQSGGRLIHVFGCAGERDALKREDMGRISGQLADLTILTTEDPRWESLDRIQGMISKGLMQAGKPADAWRRLDNRAEAIAWALSQARPGDVVIMTGKGHETSLAIKGVEQPWNEVDQVQRALVDLKNG